MPIPLGILAVAGAGAGAAGAYDLLETTVLGSDTASVTFSGLGAYSAYKHLQLRLVTRTNDSSGGLVYLRLNSDTGANYSEHRLYGNGSSVQSQGFSGETEINLGFGVTSTETANQFSAIVADILDFSNSSKNTTVRALSGDSVDVSLNSGAWYNTAAVTGVLLFPNNGSFVSGSRFSLYGIK